MPAAGLLIASGVVAWDGAVAEVMRLLPVVGFLAAVLVLAKLCDDEGLFHAAGVAMARHSDGDPRALLGSVFVVAAGIGAFSPRRLPQACAQPWYGRGIYDVVTNPEDFRGQRVTIIGGADVMVTSYTLFRLDFDDYSAAPWSGLILDEAQFTKNHQSKVHQCARRLPAPFKIASIEVGGPLKVVLHLKNPDTALPVILSERCGMMSSPKAGITLDCGTPIPFGGPWMMVGVTVGGLR